MTPRAKLVMFLLTVGIAVPCVASDPMTLEHLREQSAVDAATPEGQAYLKEFFTNPWRLAFDAAGEQCRAAQFRSGGHKEFVIALSIGDNGYPTDALVSPDDEAMRCLADQLKASSFIRPPHNGFAIYMPFRATEPGTEGRSAAPVASKATNQ